MDNKTFSIIVGTVIALAIAMFAGLYLLGLSTTQPNNSFDDGYDDPTTNTEEYTATETYSQDDSEAYTDYYYAENGDVYKDDGAYFYFDDETVVEGE